MLFSSFIPSGSGVPPQQSFYRRPAPCDPSQIVCQSDHPSPSSVSHSEPERNNSVPKAWVEQSGKGIDRPIERLPRPGDATVQGCCFQAKSLAQPQQADLSPQGSVLQKSYQRFSDLHPYSSSCTSPTCNEDAACSAIPRAVGGAAISCCYSPSTLYGYLASVLTSSGILSFRGLGRLVSHCLALLFRSVLIQLLHFQRKFYLSACCDPTQRFTYLLSNGRYKAERHRVVTADGYEIFFYRLVKVAHSCCSGSSHASSSLGRLSSSSDYTNTSLPSASGQPRRQQSVDKQTLGHLSSAIAVGPPQQSCTSLSSLPSRCACDRLRVFDRSSYRTFSGSKEQTASSLERSKGPRLPVFLTPSLPPHPGGDEEDINWETSFDSDLEPDNQSTQRESSPIKIRSTVAEEPFPDANSSSRAPSGRGPFPCFYHQNAGAAGSPIREAFVAPSDDKKTDAGLTNVANSQERRLLVTEETRNQSGKGVVGVLSGTEEGKGAKPIVFLQHGLLESSLNWITGGFHSLAFMLVEEGCDVWLGNNRGNEYVRRVSSSLESPWGRASLPRENLDERTPFADSSSPRHARNLRYKHTRRQKNEADGTFREGEEGSDRTTNVEESGFSSGSDREEETEAVGGRESHDVVHGSERATPPQSSSEGQRDAGQGRRVAGSGCSGERRSAANCGVTSSSGGRRGEGSSEDRRQTRRADRGGAEAQMTSTDQEEGGQRGLYSCGSGGEGAWRRRRRRRNGRRECVSGVTLVKALLEYEEEGERAEVGERRLKAVQAGDSGEAFPREKTEGALLAPGCCSELCCHCSGLTPLPSIVSFDSSSTPLTRTGDSRRGRMMTASTCMALSHQQEDVDADNKRSLAYLLWGACVEAAAVLLRLTRCGSRLKKNGRFGASAFLSQQPFLHPYGDTPSARTPPSPSSQDEERSRRFLLQDTLSPCQGEGMCCKDGVEVGAAGGARDAPPFSSITSASCQSWTFHDMAKYDLPAMLYYILTYSGDGDSSSRSRSNSRRPSECTVRVDEGESSHPSFSPSCGGGSSGGRQGRWGRRKVWGIGQSQGAAQLLALSSVFPEVGDFFHGLLLFSPPVILHPPSCLSVSTRALINLGLSYPSPVLHGIKIAEALLPEACLSVLGDCVAGRRLMGFYTGDIEWYQRCINFKYTPSGGTSRRNFQHWMNVMGGGGPIGKYDEGEEEEEEDGLPSQARQTTAEMERRRRRREDQAELQQKEKAEKVLKEMGTDLHSRDARGGGGGIPGPGASYPLEKIKCRVHAWIGGKDNLVNAEATTAYIKRCIKDATVELWPEAGHLDFGWARSRSVDLYPRLVRLILST